MNKLTATIKVKSILAICTKTDMAVMLGITRPTLDRRLQRNDWTKGEMALIKQL